MQNCVSYASDIYNFFFNIGGEAHSEAMQTTSSSNIKLRNINLMLIFMMLHVLFYKSCPHLFLHTNLIHKSLVFSSSEAYLTCTKFEVMMKRTNDVLHQSATSFIIVES